MRVTSKGQVTIPKHLRQRTGIKPGSEVEFAEKGTDLILRRARPRSVKKSRDHDLDSYFARVGGTLELGMSTDEYMELLRGE